MNNELPSEESKERARAADFFREAWSLALLKVGAAEEEAGRVLDRAGALAGRGEEEAKRLAKEFGERLAAQRGEFESSIEARIATAVGRLKVVRREEIEALRARLDRVEARIAALQAGTRKESA